MIYIPLFFTPLSLILLFVAFALAVWVLAAGWNGARATAHAPLPLTPESLSDSYFSIADGIVGEPAGITDRPRLSVVVFVTDRGNKFDNIIREFSAQRTTFRYEIIVVCNASARETASIAERYADMTGVRFTFIPPESQNLSRRKLAFTVGIKAAEGEAVLLTGSNAVPSSHGWFQLMGEPILGNSETNLVIGTSRFDFSSMKGVDRRYRSFLWVTDKCQSLASALAGRPYRGDWENMALRRSFFFDRKGFAHTIHIETGDDDLFIYHSDCGDSTVAVLAPAAMPEAEWGEWTSRIWKEQRIAYDFTRRWLPSRPFMMKGSVSLCNWLMLFAVIASSLAPLLAPVFSWLPAIVAVLMWISFQIIQIIFYRRAATRLMQPRLWISVPLFTLWRPIGNFIFRNRNREAIHRNFIWRR